MDGIEAVGLLLAHCETGQPMPPEARQHLAGAIRHCAVTGDRLDRALGLADAGMRSLQTRLALHRRNQHLLDAVRSVALDEGVSDWQRCKRLAPLVTAFAAGREYRATRYAPAPPDGWAAWKRHTWRALATDAGLPSSARQLYEIVRRADAYSLHDRGVNLLASKL